MKTQLLSKITALMCASPKNFEAKAKELAVELDKRHNMEVKCPTAMIVESAGVIIGTGIIKLGEGIAVIGNATSEGGVKITETGFKVGDTIRSKATTVLSPEEAATALSNAKEAN